MDLYCRKCGEPWDNDEIHEVAQANRRTHVDYHPMEVGALLPQLPTTYDDVAADFRSRGCPALGGKCSTPSTDTDRTWGLTRQEAASALYDMLGDDMDGAAAMLDDLGF